MLGEEGESESSYDSTNAFNIHHLNLKQTQQPVPGSPEMPRRQNAQSSEDPLADLKQHKTWKEH